MRCTAALLSRTYVFAAFDGRWPGVTFLIRALSGKLALGPIAPSTSASAPKGRVPEVRDAVHYFFSTFLRLTTPRTAVFDHWA
jgi:hypothetical protein